MSRDIPHALRRILVINRAPIGDVIMSSPALSLVRSMYPDAHITLLVPPACKELMAGSSVVDEVITTILPANKILQSIHKIYQALRYRFARYDACFLLEEDGGNARRLKTIAGIPIRVCASHRPGGNGNKAAAHCTHVVQMEPARQQHMVDYYREIISGRPTVSEPDSLWVAPLPEEFEAQAKEVLQDIPGPRVVLCCEGSARNRLNWPLHHWVELVKRLAADGCSLFAFVPPHGTAYMIELQQLSGVTIHHSVRSLMECAALMCHADLLVSIDTGQVHIATAVGTPVLSLAGTTTVMTYPHTQKGLAIATSPGCFDCPFKECLSSKQAGGKILSGYSPPCLEALSPDAVYRHCRLLLENPVQSQSYVLAAPE